MQIERRCNLQMMHVTIKIEGAVNYTRQILSQLVSKILLRYIARQVAGQVFHIDSFLAPTSL